MSPAVEARGVRKEYGHLVAVEDLTFAVERGQILGVLGPNGAGKTSAIRVLITILAPTRGTFAVAGVPNTRPADIRQQIGVLLESAGSPARQTGSEYLRYHARLFGHRKESARSRGRAARGSRTVRERPRSNRVRWECREQPRRTARATSPRSRRQAR
jgi:ABC-2 type transport system ATP-binding protein